MVSNQLLLFLFRASFVINLVNRITWSKNCTHQARSSSCSCSKFLEKRTSVVLVTLEAIIEFAHWWRTIIWLKYFFVTSPLAFLRGFSGISWPNLRARFCKSKAHEAFDRSFKWDHSFNSTFFTRPSKIWKFHVNRKILFGWT